MTSTPEYNEWPVIPGGDTHRIIGSLRLHSSVPLADLVVGHHLRLHGMVELREQQNHLMAVWITPEPIKPRFAPLQASGSGGIVVVTIENCIIAYYRSQTQYYPESKLRARQLLSRNSKHRPDFLRLCAVLTQHRIDPFPYMDFLFSRLERKPTPKQLSLPQHITDYLYATRGEVD